MILFYCVRHTYAFNLSDLPQDGIIQQTPHCASCCGPLFLLCLHSWASYPSPGSKLSPPVQLLGPVSCEFKPHPMIVCSPMWLIKVLSTRASMLDIKNHQLGFDLSKALNWSSIHWVNISSMDENGPGRYKLGTRMSLDIPDHVPNLCDQCRKPGGHCTVGLRCICHPKQCSKLFCLISHLHQFCDWSRNERPITFRESALGYHFT